MAREFIPQIVTANDLFEGDVVYLNENNEWVRALKDARVLNSEAEADASLTLAMARQDEIVGPYLAELGEPLHFRETFRATGPSNYKSHGKQAELANV